MLERRSVWLVVNTQVKACFRETHSLSRESKIYGSNFTKLGENIGRSLPRYKFVSEFRCLAAFSNVGGSKRMVSKMMPNFALLTPCKN